jgi:hypothetical protein
MKFKKRYIIGVFILLFIGTIIYSNYGKPIVPKVVEVKKDLNPIKSL